MKRVICHWTAGGYEATEFDREHYHILIEGDGKLVRGVHSILDNVSTADGRYAAHTRGCNTGSIGVAVCCMAGAQRSPFKPGEFPMLEVQWDAMVRVVAELCRFYDISVTAKTVLGHGEVQAQLGVLQFGKWDPMRLPFDPSLQQQEVGSLLRRQVKARGRVVQMSHEENYPSCWIDIPSMSFFGSGIVANGTTYVSANELREIKNLSLVLHTIPSFTFGRGLYFSCRQLANAINLPISWDTAARTVTIGGET